MKKTLALALIMLLSAAPSRFLAKGATNRPVMEGPDRSRPRVPCKFNVGLARDVFDPTGIRCECNWCHHRLVLAFNAGTTHPIWLTAKLPSLLLFRISVLLMADSRMNESDFSGDVLVDQV